MRILIWHGYLLEVSGSTLDDNTAPRAGGGIEANVGTTTLALRLVRPGHA